MERISNTLSHPIQYLILQRPKRPSYKDVSKEVEKEIHELENQHIDFCLMSLCEHNIIANSSFSWWASYLNKHINKKIIAPRNWFGKDTVLDTKDLYTKEMIIL